MIRTKTTVRGLVADITLEPKENSKSRLFSVVPAKLFPKATERNLIKRWCREAWRTSALAKTKHLHTTVRVKNKQTSYKALQGDFTKTL